MATMDDISDSMLNSMRQHGGRLNQAAKQYGIDKKAWLDLSTGINPNGWPVPELPASIYNRLPESDDGLIEAAQNYYQIRHLLPVSGSQEAIQLLPELFQRARLLPENPTVGIISPCYGEHEKQWQKMKCIVLHLNSESINECIDKLDILILVNPNNPTGEVIDKRIIRDWQLQLKKTGGFLISDEAFMDSTPEKSLLSLRDIEMENLIILRSVGKFFGLAGVRCGFVMAHPKLLSLLTHYQGPWSVSGPTRWIVKKALADKKWIEQTKKSLLKESLRLERLLEKYLITDIHKCSINGTVLFKTALLENAHSVFQEMAQKGVLVRILDNGKGIRFGLPANEEQWQHLSSVLENMQ